MLFIYLEIEAVLKADLRNYILEGRGNWARNAIWGKDKFGSLVIIHVEGKYIRTHNTYGRILLKSKTLSFIYVCVLFFSSSETMIAAFSARTRYSLTLSVAVGVE